MPTTNSKAWFIRWNHAPFRPLLRRRWTSDEWSPGMAGPASLLCYCEQRDYHKTNNCHKNKNKNKNKEHWQNHLWDHPHTFPLKNKWLLLQSTKPIFQNLTPKIYTTTSIRHTTNHHHKPLLDIINRDSRFLLLRSDPVPTTTLKSHKHQSSKICHHSTQVYTPRT